MPGDIELGGKSDNNSIISGSTASSGSGAEGDEAAAKFEKQLYSRIWEIVALLTIIFAIWAVISGFSNESGIFPLIMAIFSFVSATAVVIYQAQIENTDSLREVQNELRGQINDLSSANEELSKNNEELEKSLAPLKKSQKKLAKIAKQSGASVERLAKVVRENQKCLEDTRYAMKYDLKQTLMNVVFDADINEDGVFNAKELRRLMAKMKAVPGVVIRDKVFEKKLKKKKTVNSILDLVCMLHDDTIPEKKKAIVVDEKAYKLANDDDDDDSY